MNLASHKFAAFRRFFNQFSSRFTISENTFMAFIAALIGVAAGLGNLAFRETIDMIRLLQAEPEILLKMNDCILKNKADGLYNGAYEVVKLAVKK